MNLSLALRLEKAASVAFVGAGGKTSALFRLARELAPPVIVTATTHLGVNQVSLADSHWLIQSNQTFPDFERNLHGVTLVTGPIAGERTTGIDSRTIQWLREFSINHALPLLVEADGARKHPLKAPASHEPVIPDFVDTVVVVAGLSGLGKPLTGVHVHRPEIFSRLSGLAIGEAVTSLALKNVLIHPEGGLKGIPAAARRVVLLNQADTPELQAEAKSLAEGLLPAFHAVIIASLAPSNGQGSVEPLIHLIHEPVAGVILAAGGAKRFGKPKQLLPWHGKPLVRHITEIALHAGLSPVVVVLGAVAEKIKGTVSDLPVVVCENPFWQEGQSTSLHAGLTALPVGIGAVIFLLVDQPLVQPTLLRALVERHSLDLSPVIAPLVQGERANPVLFDSAVFADLMKLTGDVGGRAIFSRYPPVYLPWNDPSLLVDIDTPDEYDRLTA